MKKCNRCGVKRYAKRLCEKYADSQYYDFIMCWNCWTKELRKMKEIQNEIMPIFGEINNSAKTVKNASRDKKMKVNSLE